MKSTPSVLKTDTFIELLTLVKFKVDGTGILMANGQWQGIPIWLTSLIPWLAFDLSEPGNIHHVMINTILPGGRSGLHVDPEDERHCRWHLPLVTNPHAFFRYGDQDPVHLSKGHWWGPLEYWREHEVWNDGSEPRTHLIVDLR